MTKRLLLVSCSARKRPEPGPMAAIDRYDGPAFRIIRKRRRERRRLPRILILSAAYGLIAPNHPIADYDQVLDPQTAEMWAKNPPDRTLFRAAYLAADDVFAVAGERYLQVFDAWLPRDPDGGGYLYDYATGGIGKKLHQLKCWLEGRF